MCLLYCTVSHRCRCCCVTASVGLHLRALSNRCVIWQDFVVFFFFLPGQTNNLVPQLRLPLGERCGISRCIRTSVKAHDFKRRSLIIHAASGSCELPRCALEYSSRSMQTKKKLTTRAIGDASHYSKRSCRSDHVTPLLLFMLYFRDAIGRQTRPDPPQMELA